MVIIFDYPGMFFMPWVCCIAALKSPTAQSPCWPPCHPERGEGLFAFLPSLQTHDITAARKT